MINDVNHELLAIYKCLQDSELFELMVKELDVHENNHSEEYYYVVRGWDRNPRFELEPFICCVSLFKSLRLSEPQIFLLQSVELLPACFALFSNENLPKQGSVNPSIPSL